jgi:hypothetical protein
MFDVKACLLAPKHKVWLKLSLYFRNHWVHIPYWMLRIPDLSNILPYLKKRVKIWILIKALLFRLKSERTSRKNVKQTCTNFECDALILKTLLSGSAVMGP